MHTSASPSSIRLTPEQHERSERVRGLLEAFFDHGIRSWRGVYLHGATGSGKTLCAKWWAAQARGRGTEVFETNALEASLEAQASHVKGVKARTPFELVQAVKSAGLVVLDDMGRDRTEFSRDVLFALLDTALASDAFVIITSNRTPADLCAHYAGDDGLKSRLSALRIIEYPAGMTNWRKGGGQ